MYKCMNELKLELEGMYAVLLADRRYFGNISFDCVKKSVSKTKNKNKVFFLNKTSILEIL